jgi:hypothetical protein
MYTTKPLEYTHDLRLPDWGPFSKKYAGISHIPKVSTGMRFDLSLFPGYYRRQILVPNAKWESGYHPWEATPDLSYYAYRYELEWKDQVYCDISFSEMGQNARLMRSEFFNHTPQPQNLVLHYMAYLNFPPVRTYSDEPLRPGRVHLPKNARWLDALDYDDLGFAVSRPQDNLVYDGMWRGEVRGHGFVNGSGLGCGFGHDRGDWVQYSIALDAFIAEAILVIRYRAHHGKAQFALQGVMSSRLELPESGEFTQVQVKLGDLQVGNYTFKLVSDGGAEVELDGFVIVSQALASSIKFELADWQPVPQILEGPSPASLVLKYADIETFYGLTWQGEPWVLRQLYTDELDRFLRYYVQEHVQRVLYGNGEGHFTNVFIRPIEVPPGESRTLFGMVCSGSQSEVEQTLAGFSLEPSLLGFTYQRRKAKKARLDPTPAGERYQFSQERMAATVLTNVVYPVYTRRNFIRHYTPGKWWDCLYTWDAGFIGLGLLELDLDRAVDCLNTYTTPPGDTQAAFLHHGSMVPVQHYLFLELWNRTQDQGLLAYFYPRLRQYYRFFAGYSGTSSTTRRLKSNLLKTWDYFYNSGGWDDYPPQVYVHRNGLEGSVSPVISTAHGIRIAKILQMAAHTTGKTEDIAEYQVDIEAWEAALNRYAWDEESGYFSYVRHNPEGEPQAFLRHEGGQNYNMGLDGASPFFAGACNAEQERLILERLTSLERMWTPLGLCTVDKTAAYYRVDGYWNGAVWFPQQWFYWKALLDSGYTDIAAQIASTALEIWKKEVEASYHCFEHFIVQTGRGAGWHQFGGLCTPILLWFGAYHCPGRLTAGFDTWIQSQHFKNNKHDLEAELVYHGHRKDAYSVIATMSPESRYRVTWNGEAAKYHERYPGVLEIKLNGKDTRGLLEVQPYEVDSIYRIPNDSGCHS